MSELSFEDVAFAYRGTRLLGAPSTPVFDMFTWRVPSGRTVILGPNGAGKTTLLGLAATVIRPMRGRVILSSLDSSRRRDLPPLRRAIGWLPQSVRAVPGLTSREQVAYAGWLMGMSRSAAWRDAAVALERVDLSDQGHRLTAQLSGGQQRRVGLAQALVHHPALLLLDEPTAGLDPGQRSRFREILREIAGSVTVVVSTHQVDDLTDLYEAVAVLDNGQIVFEGTPESFIAMAPGGSARPAEDAYAELVRQDR